jgi:hypothetical protein
VERIEPGHSSDYAQQNADWQTGFIFEYFTIEDMRVFHAYSSKMRPTLRLYLEWLFCIQTHRLHQQWSSVLSGSLAPANGN